MIATRMARSCVIERGDPEITAAVASRGAEAVWESLLRSDRPSAFTGLVQVFDADVVVTKTAIASARFILPGDPEWPGVLFQPG